MKSLNEFRDELVIAQEKFVKSVNSYLQENSSDVSIKYITNYKDKEHEFTSPKSYKGTVLFRGLFFDKVDDKKMLELRKLIKTYKMASIESWTTDSDLAAIFASGHSTYDIQLGTDLFDISSKVPKDQAGVILKMFIQKDSDIAWDGKYSSENSSYSFNISNNEDSEMIVKKHRPKLEIYAIMNNSDIEFEIED